jgi:O-antigen/teichoic acid export membrane protein
VRDVAAALPEGTVVVASSLVVHGVAAYGFLALAARQLGPERFAPLGVLWTMVFLVGPGVFIPLEQELTRAIAVRRARGEGIGAVVRSATALGAAGLGVLLVCSVAASSFVVDDLLHGERALFAAFLLGLVGYLLGHVTRGFTAGTGRFRAYALYLGGEGVVRLLACIGLAAVGAATAGPYGLAVGVAPMAAVLVALAPEHLRAELGDLGPDAPRRELSTHLGALLAGSILSLALMNAGPVAVELLRTNEDAATAGTFVAGLSIARIPFFLFQGIQGALLPKLASLAGAARWADFRTGVRRLLLVVGALGVAGVVGAALLGPIVVEVVFGDGFALGRRTMTMLALAVGTYIVAMSLGQALIALTTPGRVAIGWAGGMVAFAVAVLVGDDLLLRVEVGLVAGAVAAAAVMAAQLLTVLRSPVAHPPHEPMPEAFGVVPEL